MRQRRYSPYLLEVLRLRRETAAMQNSVGSIVARAALAYADMNTSLERLSAALRSPNA